jgi:hypothetical protein
VLGALLFSSILTGVAKADGPGGVTGQVTDLRGRPLAQVRLSASSWQGKQLGAAVSDEKGRFRVPMPAQQPTSSVTLRAEARGYQNFALHSERARVWNVQLTRLVDAGYLQELAAQTDPARFRALAADMLAPSSGSLGNGTGDLDPLPAALLMRFLAVLRPRLVDYLPKDAKQLGRHDLPRDHEQALILLALWSDPADDALIDAWIAGNKKSAARPTRRCRGKTVGEAWKAWEVLHFEKEVKPGEKPPWARAEAVLAPSGDHAVVTHEVRYANWGYSQILSVVKTRDVWEVRLVRPHRHWHR